jgi:PAS domain S-box-containing protein
MKLSLFLTIIFLTAWLATATAAAPPVPAAAAIQSAAEIDYPPFSLVDASGVADGFSVELLRASLAAVNREVSFRTGPWAEVRGLLEKGEIEALPLVGRTPEREELFDFTFPYMSLHGAIVVREGQEGIRTLTDLKGRQVAVMRGDNAEEFLRREERGIKIVTTATFEEALQGLAAGRHDAVVMQHLVALRLLQDTGLGNLTIIRNPIEGFRQDFCFAVREGDRHTLALLNEGLALVMADGTYRRLHAKWFAAMQLPANRAVVIGGDHNYPPFEFLDDKGRPAGFTVELTRAIAHETNMAVQIRLGPWAEIAEGLRKGEIDAIQGIFYSLERDRAFDFSPFHLVAQFTSVVRDDFGPPPESFADLAKLRLVVQRGDIVLDLLAAHGLEGRAMQVPTQEEVLQAIAAGKADCAILPRLNSLYLIEKYGWSNLVTGHRPLHEGEYGYAVPSGDAALLAQFSEGLRILQENGEYRRIYEKWLGVYEKQATDLATTLRYVAMAALPLLALLAVFVFWSWSLRRQVAHKTRELQESANLFKDIFDTANVGKSLTMPSGAINANQAYAEMLGYNQEELAGKTWQELTPDEDITMSEAQLAPLLRGEKERARYEKRYIHKNGSLVWADVSTVIRRDSLGRPLHFVTTIVDISEHKKGQLRIEHLNRVLRTIRDINQLIVRERDREALIREGCRLLVSNRGYLSAMIVLTDRQQRPLTWAMEGLAAVSAELTTTLRQGILPACCQFAHAQQEVLLVTDRQTICSDCPIGEDCAGSQSLAASLTHAGRTYGYLTAATEPHLAVDEEESGLFAEMAGDFAYALNVLEIEMGHKESEEALQESESRFRLFAELAPVGIVILDGQGRTLYASSKFTELFGYTMADIPSLDQWWPLAYPDPVFRGKVEEDWRLTLDKAQRSQSEGGPVEYPVACKDGRVRQVEFRLATTGTLTVVVLTDITARKQTEEERDRLHTQLNQAQKIESIGRLAGGVAHDYNNMLTVIIGYTELAMVKAQGSLQKDLQEVLAAAQRAKEITRQLLAFARKQTIAPRVLDLNDAVEGMLRMLRRLIGEDIDLSWRPGPGLWSVNIDPSQLDQLLANLCVNARDAIADVGKLTIETKNTPISDAYCSDHFECVPGEYVMLAVSDDGCGMDRATLDKLFEPFFTTKEVGQGTGLGLATVYGIVRQNNGFINVYSEPGAGSTFKIYLPRHQGEEEQPVLPATTEIPRGQGETVLLVEDEAAILKMAGKILANQGYRVLEAATPKVAMELAQEHGGDIALLLTDVVMPEMNGRDLAAALRPFCPGLKVLFMSGYTANVIAHRGVLDADINFIQKPFSNRDLAGKVHEALMRQ